MINGKRIAVVMPAYNAEKTLEQTVQALSDLVDIKILVDDSSKDQTAALSRSLGVETTAMDATSKPATARRLPRALTSW
jgi:cellulose synthase/poly-beta-1,6-N-acetylglucosamine synthase-like glycosyltransferase